ncbi:MAG TPA: PEGA domain-containing protein, partial [Kofleriaceae bacterium]
MSRCTSVDELVDTFANLIDETTLFICTKNVFDVGLRRRFSVTLRNGTPVLRGEAEVQESPARLSGPTSPIGIRLRLLKLTPDSLALRERLLERKREKEVTQVDPLPLPPVPMPPVRTITPKRGRSGRFQTTPGAGPVMPPGQRISGIMAAMMPDLPPPETPSEVIRADSVPNKVESVQVKIETGPVKAELSDPHIPIKPVHNPEASGRTLNALARALERGAAPAPPVVPPASAAAALASAVSLKPAVVPPPSPPARAPSALPSIGKPQAPDPSSAVPELTAAETTIPETTAERTTPRSPSPADDGEDDSDSIAELEADAKTQTRPRSPSVSMAELPHEERAPSSDIILPANPLSEISDRSLEAMIEVVIYEDDLPPRDESFDTLLTPRPMTIPPALAVPPAESASNGASARLDLGALSSDARARTATASPYAGEARGGGGGRFIFALVAIALGFGSGYLVFGTDLVRKRAAPSSNRAPAAVQPGTGAPAPAPAGEEEQPADPTAAEPTPASASSGSGDKPAAASACTAAIDTSPPTARVLLDGREAGVGSLEDVVVPCDREFSLKVEHAGYKTFDRRFTAATGVPLRIDAALTRQEPVVSKKSKLRISTEPAGAIVTVDGKVIGRGPASVTVGTGDTVFITATLKGHKGWSKKVYV